MAPGLVEYGSIHDEVYLVLRPLTDIMRLYGLFPIHKHSNEDKNDKSVVDKMKFRWYSKLMFLTLLTFSGVLCCYISESWDFIPRVPDPLERLVLKFILTILCLSAVVNLYAMVIQGPKWRSYFKQWQQVDSLLNITLDKTLHSFVMTISKAYHIYMIVNFGSVLYVTISKYIGPNEDDYSGHGFVVGMFTYCIFINGCQLLPELLFICICFAIKTRIHILILKTREILTRQSLFLQKFPTNDKPKIADDLQLLRISFQCILQIMKSTNAFIGPVLCSCVLLTTTYLSVTIFMIFFQTLDNAGFVSLKIVFSTCCMIRLMSVCLFADQIKIKISELKREIYLIPSIQLRQTQESLHELELLLAFTRKSRFSFTGFEFFSVDKELLNKMTGAILTYSLTILEFSLKK